MGRAGSSFNVCLIPLRLILLDGGRILDAWVDHFGCDPVAVHRFRIERFQHRFKVIIGRFTIKPGMPVVLGQVGVARVE